MKEGLPATTSEECMGEGKVLMRIVPCELDLKRWAQFSREESESSEGWRDGRERPWKAGKRRECEGRTSHSVWLKYGTNRWWGRKHKKSMLGSNKPVPKMLSFGGYNSENRGYKGEPDRCPSLPSGSGHSSGGWGSQVGSWCRTLVYGPSWHPGPESPLSASSRRTEEGPASVADVLGPLSGQEQRLRI